MKNTFSFKLDWYEFKKKGLPKSVNPSLELNEVIVGLSLMIDRVRQYNKDTAEGAPTSKLSHLLGVPDAPLYQEEDMCPCCSCIPCVEDYIMETHS